MKTFFAPAHITGFFEIFERKNPSLSGSRGAGIVLTKGVNTGVIIKDSDENRVKVFYDKRECSCKTTRSVVDEMLNATCGAFDVEVHHFPQLPLAYGLGVSGSGALGTALALNDKLELDLDYNQLGNIAHMAEVVNQTGLGDVSAEISKGLVIRMKEGAPGFGKTRSIPLDRYVVCFIVGRPLLTKSVLNNKTKRLAINVVGKKCMKSILKDPSPQRFMELSYEFTNDTGLAQRNVEKAISVLENAGYKCGMCMLGNAIFTLTHDPERVSKVLDYPSISLKALETDITHSD